jgi:hypothetical protein
MKRKVGNRLLTEGRALLVNGAIQEQGDFPLAGVQLRKEIEQKLNVDKRRANQIIKILVGEPGHLPTGRWLGEKDGTRITWVSSLDNRCAELSDEKRDALSANGKLGGRGKKRYGAKVQIGRTRPAK